MNTQSTQCYFTKSIWNVHILELRQFSIEFYSFWFAQSSFGKQIIEIIERNHLISVKIYFRDNLLKSHWYLYLNGIHIRYSDSMGKAKKQIFITNSIWAVWNGNSEIVICKQIFFPTLPFFVLKKINTVIFHHFQMDLTLTNWNLIPEYLLSLDDKRARAWERWRLSWIVSLRKPHRDNYALEKYLSVLISSIRRAVNRVESEQLLKTT